MSNIFTFKTLSGSKEALEYLQEMEIPASRRGKKISITKQDWNGLNRDEQNALSDELHQFGGRN